MNLSATPFKLGILIPLKSKQVSEDWQLVQNLLFRVLMSINNQTSDNFECVVVGHEEPDFFLGHEKIKNTRIIKFDELLPPDLKKYSGVELQLQYEVDRCSKITKGMMVLDNESITHWFALDADDLLHKDFVSSVQSLSHYEAILIEKGYFYFESNKIVNKTDEFYQYCGSSCVISKDLSKIPSLIDAQTYKTTFYGSVSHVHVKNYFKNNGIKYTTPDARLAMYVRGTTENISQFYIGNWLGKLKQEFVMRLRQHHFSSEQFTAFGIH